MLEVESILDPVKTNAVQFFEKFGHKGHTCLAFELPDRNFCQLLMDRHRKLQPGTRCVMSADVIPYIVKYFS